MHSVENFQDRRLARAILAEQRMNLAAEHFEMDVIERSHAAKMLRDPREPHCDRALRRFSVGGLHANPLETAAIRRR